MLKMGKEMIAALTVIPVSGLLALSPLMAGQVLTNSMSKCAAGAAGPAVLVKINNISSAKGKVRVQIYPATKSAWMKKGAWLSRIELPAKAGSMSVCVPVAKAGSYGIAVRHDLNANGKTDLSKDGGGMSNNPSINIFNLGKPPVEKVAFRVDSGVKTIAIKMKYM